MEIVIFYILIFCIGTLFGSFFTLAVYRLPLHQDITHKRSYCPNCNHKLSFLDMIPILSYVFLGGKCRYCKTKIRIRYLLLEVVTGLLFLSWVISLKIDFSYIQTSKLIYLVVSLLYLAGIIIIAGIDKEKRTIFKSIILYEIILESIYMIYLYVLEGTNIYRYVIYLIAIILLLIADSTYYKKYLKDNYILDMFILSIVMTLFLGTDIYIFTLIITLLSVVFNIIWHWIKNKTNKYVKNNQKYLSKTPIGFYMCCSNIIVALFFNFLTCGW